MLPRIRNILSKNRFLIIIFILITFVRFYKLEEFVTFLGDQGRDAIIIKRIATLEKFPAIGPVSSIGSVFLGPFYYYLMTPFLLLFNFDPLGLAFGVAFLSIIFLALCYLMLKKQINNTVAVIFILLAGFSQILVEFNRFSWNPNLLPFLSFFTLSFLTFFLKSKKRVYLFAFGSFLSLSLQLHYLAFLLFLTILLFAVVNFSKIKSFISLKNLFIAIGAFFLFYSPLVIFDLRHQFLNSKNLLNIFTEKKIITSLNPWQRFLETNQNFFNYLFKLKISIGLTLILFVFFVFIFVKNKFFKNNFLINIHYLNFFSYLIGFSLLQSYRYPHYYMGVYLSFFLILAYWLSNFYKKNFFKPLIYIFLSIYLFINFIKYPFLKKEGNHQIKIARKIAQSILDNNPHSPYQIVPIPFTEMDGHIRYFLEIGGKRPLAEDSPDEGNELYVLCYEKSCDVLNHPQWQIAAFKNKKISSIWKIDRVKIYKIIHGR